MRTRQEIKEQAKYAFTAQRSKCIVAVLLVMLIPFGLGLLSGFSGVFANLGFIMGGPGIEMFAASILFSLILSVVAIPVTLFILVMTANLDGVMVKVYYGQPITETEPYQVLNINFGRKLGGMCWMALWIYLWTLVGMVSLFIPTIIKSLSYFMVPYILGSNPNVSAIEALNLSKRMTKGHKGKLFVMHLSFIGWGLLSALTLGILGIFYVYPYMLTSYAGFFVELRNLAIANGTIHPSEFEGIPPHYAQHAQYAHHPHYQSTPQYMQQPEQYMQQPQYAPAPQPQQYTQQPQYAPAPQPQQYTQQQQYAPPPEPPQPPEPPTTI